MVARGYANHTGMDVFYPIYPSVSEVSLLKSIEVLYEVYCKIIKKYGAKNTAIVGPNPPIWKRVIGYGVYLICILTALVCLFLRDMILLRLTGG